MKEESKFLEGLDEQTVLHCLAPPVERRVIALDSQELPWDQIGSLLSATPAAALALKGTGWNGRLWGEVKNELHKFLCSEADEYSDLRAEWDALKERGSSIAIASLSGIVGSQLGVASGVVAPMVIWGVAVALRIGRESACRAFAPQDNVSHDEPPTA